MTAVAAPDDLSELDVSVEPAMPDHALVLGDKVFACADKLPVSTLIRYADNDLLGLHHILRKVVLPEEQEAMWDAFEELDEEESMEAIKDLIASYADRPTKERSSSAARSKRTARR